MSIGPVETVGLVTEQPTVSGIRPPGQSPPTVPKTAATETLAQTEPGIVSTPEEARTKNLPAPTELPQDEVQVQRDSQLRDEVVIKYLDGANGDLILQVPSAEVLNVDQGIYQEFQQRAQVKDETSTAAVVGKGEKSHGH